MPKTSHTPNLPVSPKRRLLPAPAAVALAFAFCIPPAPAQEPQAAPAPAPVPPPADLSAPLNEARHLLTIADYAGADHAMRALIAEHPKSPDAHFLLGFALLHEQKPTESLAEYTEGAKFRDPSADELLGVASDYIVLKSYTDAERWLLAAAKLAPERPITWYLLGRTQYNLNHWTDAEKSFLTCLRLDPHHERAEYNLGLVYEMLQRPESAVTAYRTAISWQETSTEKDPQPYLDLGTLLRKQGKAAEALPLLTIAAASSKNPLAHQELGLTYEQLGRYDEAIGEMKLAVSYSPNVEAPHFFLGRLYRRTGHKDEAAHEFTEAARLAGTQTDAAVPNRDVPHL